MLRVALIDYGSGNLKSAHKALEAVVGAQGNVLVTAEAYELEEASHIILPGVGAFGDCMAGLAKTHGMIEALERQVLGKRKPFLGICVGMQLLARRGLEHGEHRGLGWLPAEVVPLCPNHRLTKEGPMQQLPTLRVPHMGWNNVQQRYPHPVLDGLPQGAHAYFVHSYHMLPREPREEDMPNWCLATTDYGHPVFAAVGQENILGLQFHPEKSQAVGLQILQQFTRWRP